MSQPIGGEKWDLGGNEEDGVNGNETKRKMEQDVFSAH